MDIIDRLIENWISSKSDLCSQLDDNQVELQNLLEKKTYYTNERANLDSNFKDDCSKLGSIKDFCDMIGIDHSEINLLSDDNDFSEVYAYEEYELEEEIDSLQEKIDHNIASGKMLKKYIGILDEVTSADHISDRDSGSIYRPDFELCIDMFLMQQWARSQYSEISYAGIDSQKYLDIVGIFCVETMKNLGHYPKDEYFTNGRAENICRICRISWLYEYFVILKTKLRAGIIKPRKVKKELAYTLLCECWHRDIYELKNSGSFIETEYFQVFNSILPQNVIDDIDYFIRKL